MGHVSDPQLRVRAIRWQVPLLASLDRRGRGGLVVSHGDLNLTNFVQDAHGTVHLIDLEGVRLAVPEMDAAMLAMTCILDQVSDLWRELRPLLGPLDPDDFAWCLRQKLAGSLAWAAWQESQGNTQERSSLARREALAVNVVRDPCFLLR